MYDCLIIGHSGGLGNEIFKLHKNPLGVSLDNGYDISNFSSREKIVKNAKDIAIIYIVASSNENRFAQIDMLSELWDEYKDQHKKIVVISGSSPQYTQTKLNLKRTFSDDMAKEISKILRSKKSD